LSLSFCDKKADEDAETVAESAAAAATGGSEVEPSKPADLKTSPASSEASSDDSIVDQWKRSIVVNDVSKENLDMLIMNLELKKRGGGHIDTYTYDDESRKVLVTFGDTAGNRCRVLCCFVIYLISQ